MPSIFTYMSRKLGTYLKTAAQALHGLAPQCKLINMHELINNSTNNCVTLSPLENGTNI